MRKRPRFLHLLFLIIGVSLAHSSYSQTHFITGKIIGKDGVPLEGATIKAEGKNASVISRSDGSFQINSAGSSQLQVSHVGYKGMKIKISSNGGPYNITLVEEVSLIDEVVVTAIGTKTKKREQGYTSTTIKGSELNISKPTVLASALAGKVAGLEISAVGGGVNPNYRLILRGQRSITGNNNALIVVDNVIVPSEILNNLNPEDVSDITILNGASGVALYGSSASNGALIVTTKRAKNGPPQVTASNTTTFESVAFNPKLQKSYGSGGDGYGINSDGTPVYAAIENESYGPKFDGTTRDLGVALEDGSILTAPYSYFKDRNKFWQTGTSNQTDFSVSSGDERSSLLLSGQYLKTNGTTYNDRYTRAAIRINGSRKISDKIEANYSAYYVQNRYNITTNGTGLYDEFLNMPANVPITHFKDWKNNKFANPNGYYNPWYQNPYFDIDNNRELTNNDYLLGTVDLKYTPLKWLTITSRTGFETRSIVDKFTAGKFTFTQFAKDASGGAKTDLAGSVSDDNYYTNQLTSNFLAEAKKTYKDLSFYLLGGVSLQQNYEKYTAAGVSGLVDSGLYNLSNSLNKPSASANLYQARQLGAFYQFKVGYKDFLYVNTTGRNDWVSVLNPNNRSFFYPAVDASFVATEAFDGLKDIGWLDALKLRASWSKVGQVNLQGYTYGAYALQPTFSQANGYPYNGVAGFTVNGTIVAKSLMPEITKGYEGGFDFTLLKNAIDGSITYYSTHTTNQTITTGVSSATGFSSYLTNTGETSSKGLEVRLSLTPIRTKDWTVNLNGTYSYNDNKVLSISSTLSQLSISSYTYAGSYAVPHMQFPQLYGTDYNRDDKGRVIVDATTGMPSINTTLQYLGNANARNILGFTPNVRYKQFSLSAVLEYRGGFKRYNAIGSDLDWSGMGIRTVAFNRQRFVFPNSVYLDGTGKYVENKTVTVNQGNGNGGFWTAAENMNVATNYISSGSYIKLRQLSLSYSVPQSVLKGTKAIKAATVSVQGRNLFLWLPKDNLYTDPDYSSAGSDSNGIGLTGYQSPPSRYYGFTLSLTL